MRKLSLIVMAIVCSLMSLTTAYGSTIVEKHANWLANETGISYKFAYDITKYVYQTCEHPILVLSIIPPESNGDPKARRKKSRVYGLGQINWFVWGSQLKILGINRPEDLLIKEKNILAMNYITKIYFNNSKKNISKTIKSYVGPGQYKHKKKIANNIYVLNKLKGGSKRV